MARYTGPVCKLCRREGTKLFLKGTRCLTEKCAIERRAYAPGQHGQSTGRRRKASEYAKQLREKQKVKRIYGLSERQFRNLFDRVLKEPGITGTNLLVALETRLDNVVYRMGFATSRRQARQLVRHGHIQVNGGKVDVPSYRVKPGQEVRVAPADRELRPVNIVQELTSRAVPLSSLRGSAVWAFRMDGVVHEHQTVQGVLEDVHQIIQRLKALTIVLDEDVDETVLRIRREGKGPVLARDIQESASVRVVNPDHLLFTVQDDRDISCDLYVNKGRGYVEAEMHPVD